MATLKVGRQVGTLVALVACDRKNRAVHRWHSLPSLHISFHSFEYFTICLLLSKQDLCN